MPNDYTKLDPTRTLLTRKAFERDLNKRRNEFKKWLTLLLALWLRDRIAVETFIQEFNSYFTQAFPNTGWFIKYIYGAYLAGGTQARQLVRPDLATTPEGKLLATGGITAFLATLDHTTARRRDAVYALTAQRIETLGAQAVATATALIAAHEGKATATVAAAIKSEVLGLIADKTPLLAEEAVTRGHAEGSLDAYELLGVTRVGADVEFVTAAGRGATKAEMVAVRVCPKCQALSGKVYTIQQARGIIPVHLRCRCRWVPA